MPQILANIQQTSDILRLYNTLLVLRKIIKRYEFKRQ